MLPLETLEDPPPATYSRYLEVLPLIHQALERRQVRYCKDDVELCYRALPGEAPSDEDVTILVQVTWTTEDDGQSWYQAADEIRGILLRSWATRSVKVELIDWRLSAPRIMSVVEDNHSVVEAWPVVNPLIHDIIADYPKLQDGWRSIDVVRIGLEPSEHGQSAPILPVTISITVDWSLDSKDWAGAERRIEDLLERNKLQDVKVQFERGDVEPQGFPLLYPSRYGKKFERHQGDYPQVVPMGACFSAEKYPICMPTKREVQPGIGTIGGYLEIRRKGGDWKKFAVTNYHCSRAAIPGYGCKDKDEKSEEPEPEEMEVPEGSLLRVADVDGLGPDRAIEAQITYEVPSRRVHNHTLKHIEGRLDKYLELQAKSPESEAVPRTQELIDKLRAEMAGKTLFFDEGKHKLGSLWLCTGYKQRSSLNGRVDVAFIDVAPHRIGKNLIASESAWKEFDPPMPSSCGKPLKGIASCKLGADLGPVFKVGARTGATSGCFSKIRSDVKINWDPQVGMGFSREYCFVADPAARESILQNAGDSGSFVFTWPRRWLGQIWGGTTKTQVNRQTLAYVTDAQDIIDWVGGLGGGEGEFEARLPEEG